MPCTTVTNFCNEGKVMVLLSMVRHQVLLCFRHTHTDAIAMNKLCKLNFRYFTMYLAISQQQVLRASLNMVFTFLRLYIFLIFNSIIK